MLLNDLWSFDVGGMLWQRLGGSGSGNSWPTSSWPGARRSSCVWVSPHTNAVYLFGGHGLSAQGLRGDLSDLWKFEDGAWTLLGSSEGVVPVPINQPSTANWPGARRAAQSFVDAVTGDLLLFGGFGFGSGISAIGSLNDLWRYRPATNRWELVAGAPIVNDQGRYGSIGVASALNLPPARSDMAGWVSGSKLFIFGGFGPLGFFNDVWVFEGGVWTWIAGQTGANHAGSAVMPGNRFGATAHLNVNTNKVFLFGGYSKDGSLNELWEFDLLTRTFSLVGGRSGPNWTSNYCARGNPSAAVLPGGRVRHGSWMLGGDLFVFGGFGIATQTSPLGYLNDLFVLKSFPNGVGADSCGGMQSVQLVSGSGQTVPAGASDTSATTIAVAVSVSVGALALLVTAAMLVYRFLLKPKTSRIINLGSPMSPQSPVSPQMLILELKDLRTSGTDHKMVSPHSSLSPRRALDFDASE